MKQETPKSDLRKIRTKKLLRDALISLMAVKPAADITVKELIETAQIGRSTFYMHYTDKDDFIEKTVDEFLQYYETQSRQFDKLPYNEYIFKQKRFFFEYVRQNRNFFTVMFNEHNFPHFYNKLLDMGMRYMYRVYEPAKPNDAANPQNKDKVHMYFDITANYIVSANIGFIKHWLESDLKFGAGFCSKKLSKFSYAILDSNGIVKKQNL